MTNKKFKVPGWRVELGDDRITFDRGDWFCVARFCDVLKFARGEDSFYTEAAEIVMNFLRDGAPIRRFSSTFHAMSDAIAEAAKASRE